MRSNIKLGKISGIEIGLQLQLVHHRIPDRVLPRRARFRGAHANWSRGEIWSVALITAALFFVSIIVHELAHSRVAQKRGLKVRAITLFALGGVSQIEGGASDAKTEFWVAIAGPISSFVIGLVCLDIALGLGWHRLTEPHDCGYRDSCVAGVYQHIPGCVQYDSCVSSGRRSSFSFDCLGNHQGCRPRYAHSCAVLARSWRSYSFSTDSGDISRVQVSAGFGSHSPAGF